MKATPDTNNLTPDNENGTCSFMCLNKGFNSHERTAQLVK